MMDINLLTKDLVLDEGRRQYAYRDTKGILTIGIGRNLDDKGLSDDEIDYLLRSDISDTMADLDRNIPWWRDLSEPRQRALANMCFNLGWPRLSWFKKMLAALKAGNFEAASEEALASVWARQVGARSVRISRLIRNG